MDCRYCALQVYLNRPVLEVFVNVDDLLESLGKHLEADSQRFHRICTGSLRIPLRLTRLQGWRKFWSIFFRSRTEPPWK